MKKYLILLLCLMIGTINAQDTTTIDGEVQTELTAEVTPTAGDDPSVLENLPDSLETLTEILSWNDAIFFILVILVGYLSFMIPGLKGISNTNIRVGTAALIMIVVFVSNGWANAVPLIIEFVMATKLYDLALKGLKKTPTVETKAEA